MSADKTDYAGRSGAHTPQMARYRRNAESLRRQIRECLDAGFEPRMETRSRLFIIERAIAKAEGR